MQAEVPDSRPIGCMYRELFIFWKFVKIWSWSFVRFINSEAMFITQKCRMTIINIWKLWKLIFGKIRKNYNTYEYTNYQETREI